MSKIKKEIYADLGVAIDKYFVRMWHKNETYLKEHKHFIECTYQTAPYGQAIGLHTTHVRLLPKDIDALNKK